MLYVFILYIHLFYFPHLFHLFFISHLSINFEEERFVVMREGVYVYIYIHEGIMNDFPLFTTSAPTPFTCMVHSSLYSHISGTYYITWKEKETKSVQRF